VKLWTPILSTKQTLNLSLDGDITDAELMGYQMAAQRMIEKFCGREFDSEILREEFRDPTGQDNLVLKYYPVRGAVDMSIDNNREFNSNVDTSDFFVNAQRGLLYLASGRFRGLNSSIKLTYRGGYAPVVSAVDLDDVSGSMTVSNDIAGFLQPMDLYLATAGAGKAGVVEIEGEGLGGSSQTEVVKIPSPISSGQRTLVLSGLKWTKIDSVDASDLETVEDIPQLEVLATGFPEDLQLAVRLLAAFYMSIDEKDAIITGSRSIGGRSETFDKQDVPTNIARLIQKYRTMIPV